MITKCSITQCELHQILAYDPETGVFTWLVKTCQRMNVGDVAGFVKKATVTPTGRHVGAYRRIKIGGKGYAASRLAWLYMTGEWPELLVDHIDQNTSNDKFENLRLATHKQNLENARSEGAVGNICMFRGVSWTKGKYYARITHFGEYLFLGSFDDFELAKEARLEAERKLFTHSMR